MSCDNYSKLRCLTMAIALKLALLGANAYSQTSRDFGADVFIFNPSMPMEAIQSNLNQISASRSRREFGTNRNAICFTRGVYSNLDINVGFYTQVLGLGQTPDDVRINGLLHSEGRSANHIALVNFWRSAENLSVCPTNNDSTMTWAVSQGTSLRRVHILGNLSLANTNEGAWSSGGFLADSKIDSIVNSRTQQQWLSRNDSWQGWLGHNWNMVFVGVTKPPTGTWPNPPYTVVPYTPLIREKPYLSLDGNGHYIVMVPDLETNSLGITWATGHTPGITVPLSRFYLAQPGAENTGAINAALEAGQNLLLTPGIYHLTNSILVTRPDTIVLGLGYPTLVPDNGNPTMIISDVSGVKVAGLIFDAGVEPSSSLLQVGDVNSSLDHSSDPTCLYDISMRVGGATSGTTASCLVINANNVLGDNLWLWRADHGAGASWTRNTCNNGLIVNGSWVTIYGLFVEHHEQYQTLWNGNDGRLYFYQSELPYDAPSQSLWQHNGTNGYAAYKVGGTVKNHEAYGLGVYGVFTKTTASCFDAVETPTAAGVNLHHVMDIWITGQEGTEITHVLNGTGDSVNSGNRKATLNY
jgi:hypothetical protein